MRYFRVTVDTSDLRTEHYMMCVDVSRAFRAVMMDSSPEFITLITRIEISETTCDAWTRMMGRVV